MAGTITASKTTHRVRGLVRLSATLLTDAAGVVTAGSMGSAFGRVVAVEYAPGTLATGADIIIKDQAGATVVSLTDAGTTPRRFRPTAVITTNAGVAVAAAATATLVDRDIYVGGPLTVEVAQGGNAVTGAIHLLIDESLGVAGN